MPRIRETGLQDLRLRYNAVYTAHQSCVRAVTEGRISGQPPAAALLAKEAKALDELAEARRNLLAGILATNRS